MQADGLSLLDGSGAGSDGYPHLVEAVLLQWLPLLQQNANPPKK